MKDIQDIKNEKEKEDKGFKDTKDEVVENISIFDNIDEGVKFPEETGGDEDSKDLIIEGVEDAITKDTIHPILIPDDIDIRQPNYVIDMSNIKEIDKIQVTAIDAMLNEDGEVAVYIYIGGEIKKMGMGYSNVLDRLIAIAVRNILGDEAEVYKDYVVGEDAKVIDDRDITHLRLNI